MVRKFNKEKEAWVKFGIFYYKSNKLSDGRFLLQRSLQSLEKRDHLEITSKFAQIEFRSEKYFVLLLLIAEMFKILYFMV